MKKLFVLVFLFFVGIINVNAYGIGDYYIDYTVQTNGDVLVKEIFVLNNYENGYERRIFYKDVDLPIFDGSVASFEGSDIYNGSGLRLITVKYMPFEKIAGFSDLLKDGVKAELVDYALNGDFGKYTVVEYEGATYIRMYNHYSNDHHAFYLEYMLEDVAVSHNDVAEIGWYIFSDLQEESISNMQVRINLPGNENEARIWGHGPLFGETKIADPETMFLMIERFDAKTPIDMRIVFDREVISESNKKSNVNGLDSILKIEGEKADEANELREAAKAAEQRMRYIGYLIEGLMVIWFIFLMKRLKQIKEYKKPYETIFKTKYFRDFPNDYNPTTVSYLLDKKVEKKDISACVLDLVQRKVLKYEKFERKDYKFSLGIKDSKMTKSEEYILDFFLREIGNEGQFTIKDINNYARKKSEDFIKKYDMWWTMATKEAKDYNFFYDKTKEEKGGIAFASLGFLIVFLGFAFGHILASVVVLLLSIGAIIYIAGLNKRTKEANESYVRWLGLKNFLNDFGNFKERELPQIELWEKYLVYATIFGNAKKLAKQMEIKFKEMPEGQVLASDMVHFNTFNALNLALAPAMRTSAAAAQRVVASAASSGGGFGGGFSGGGGGFGGGGGGGRF